ncbi:MAG: D-arabinose 5-phosphate isomerase [Candidatus Cloacimonadota bacterium]|nr:MAG: D-arabinose 5-phosphate isomerase [Candidatus Cloacimonadota bacterium]
MDIKKIFINVLQNEAKAIMELTDKIDDNVEKAIDLLFQCKGKIVVTGMGKTGIIARKLAGTFASTGTTAIYLHPAEGVHGDLGMVSKGDIALIVSYSGTTDEIVSIIPYFKRLKLKIISLTGNDKSILAQNSDVVLNIGVRKEYEPYGIVPTASTTTALATGNALAVALLEKKSFKPHDFAIYHPGGTIGKKLLLKVKDVMHTGEQNPVISINHILKDAILEMSSKRLGCVSIIDNKKRLVGIITDGDLRRIFQKYKNPLQMEVSKVMTKNPKSISAEMLGVEALNLMEKYSITMLPVADKNNNPYAMLHLHDLIKAGIL